MKQLLIAPSILAADFGRLAAEAKRAEQSGADCIHVDIMDGVFVPNISFGIEMVHMLQRETHGLPLDVHLMIQYPDRYAKDFIKAGASTLTVHLEATHNVGTTLATIREQGCRAGLAINPATPFQLCKPHLDSIDLLLCMTVNPGFGGQPFMPDVLEKVKEAEKESNGRYDIEVDGGINFSTVRDSRKAGANVMVAGTALFAEADMKSAIAKMRACAEA